MVYIYSQAKFLDRDEFALALRKGQGRAQLHVIQNGLDSIDDLVLEACIHNQVYDQQIESGRGDWLYSMFKDSPFYPRFRGAILNALRTETEIYNLFQLIQLAGNMALVGDEEARSEMGKAVYRIAADPDSNDWIGAEDWLDVKGAEGMLELARIYGRRLLQNPDDIVNEYLLTYEGHPNFPEVMKQNAEIDPDIRRYQDYLEQRKLELAAVTPLDRVSRLKNTHDRIRNRYTLQGILEDARKKRGSYPGHYVTFGKHATDEELLEIYRFLINEPDEEVRTRLLWVFRRTKLPSLDQKLFQWAYSPNIDLRSATINALAQLSGLQVHILAIEKIKTGELTGGDQDVLDLLMNNYTSDDAKLINQGLSVIQPDMDDAHSISFSIIEIAKRYQDPNLLEAVLWTYEHTPCALCRLKSVEWLVSQEQLPAEIAFECEYDANEDIHTFIKEAVDGESSAN